MVTTSSLTSAKPQVSPSEKITTTASVTPLKSSDEDEDDEEASDEHGEFNYANFLFVSLQKDSISLQTRL